VPEHTDGGKTHRWPHNRLHQLQKIEKRDPAEFIPRPGVGGYLIEMLFDMGASKSAPMGGNQPLDWIDVWAYTSVMGQDLEPWEARAVMDMSIAYVRMNEEGKNPLSIMPIRREDKK